MKTEVDSSQKKLPYPIIITQALTKRTEKVRTGKEGLAKELLQFESFVQKPDVKINNTVFLIKIDQNNKSCVILPFNMDTEKNFINNIKKIIYKLIKEGILKGVFGSSTLDQMNIYKTVKEEIGIPMGISQTQGTITCIFDASIILKQGNQ
mgnify:CR=1 FL=1